MLRLRAKERKLKMSEKATWIRADDGELYPLPEIPERVPAHLSTDQTRESVAEAISRNVMIVDLQKKLIEAEEKVQKYETEQVAYSEDTTKNERTSEIKEKVIKSDYPPIIKPVIPNSIESAETNKGFVIDKNAALAYSLVEPSERWSLWTKRNAPRLATVCICSVLFVLTANGFLNIDSDTVAPSSESAVVSSSEIDITEPVEINKNENVEASSKIDVDTENFDDYSSIDINTKILSKLGPVFAVALRLILSLLTVLNMFLLVLDTLQMMLS